MKYSVEIENGIAKETLVFNGKEFTRTTEKVIYGSISYDMDFSEQLENKRLPKYFGEGEILVDNVAKVDLSQLLKHCKIISESEKLK